jgi:orotate phosphoribosyltransferase
MTTPADMARDAAKILIETKSVIFNIDPPFTYTSGRKGPVYTDVRRLISFPAERNLLMDHAAELIKDNCKGLDMVAGGETAGIPYAAFVAERLKKPMLYVRKKPKGHGRMAQIEGVMDEPGQNVILVEDLQTDGGSKKLFIDALRAAGAEVTHSFVVFHYGIFEASKKNMESLGINLLALATWWDILQLAKDKKYFDTKTLDAVEAFLNDPVGWSVAHGGKGDDVTEDAA